MRRAAARRTGGNTLPLPLPVSGPGPARGLRARGGHGTPARSVTDSVVMTSIAAAEIGARSVPSPGRRRVLDLVPLTPLGLLAGAVGWLAMRELGEKHQDFVLFVVGKGALGVIALMVVLVIATSIGVALSLRGSAPPAGAQAGDPIELE